MIVNTTIAAAVLGVMVMMAIVMMKTVDMMVLENDNDDCGGTKKSMVIKNKSANSSRVCLKNYFQAVP